MPEAPATFVYDGDCVICRYWVDYWRRQTRGVVYRPYQEAARDYPQIPEEAFRRSVQFVEPDGHVYSGAAATYRLLRHIPGRGFWWALYRWLPGFSAVSERGYAFFARHRGLLATLSHLLWGPKLEPERYDLVSFVFLRLLGLIYVSAFASLSVQVVGLVGGHGILPAADYLQAASGDWGRAAYWRLPTLFWFDASDTTLRFGTYVGIVLGLLVVFGVWTRAALAALFILYLSYVYAGQTFMTYQWDLLLLEAGFLAIFLPAGSRITIWLYRWLVFRYLFESGLVKILSTQPTWQDLSALRHFFMTQPLPAPLAWYAAELPARLLVIGTLATLLIELVLVFFIFLPRRLRAFTAWCVIAFQVLIMLGGNYGFFNLLTIALTVFLFDDAAVGWFFSSITPRGFEISPRSATRSATIAASILACIVVPVGADRLWQSFTHAQLPIIGMMTDALSPLLIVNGYGPFATTTTTRPEIIVEGSDDAQHWREYVFRHKPGPVDRAPSWNIPHQPRLDWQMWFAAYSGFAENAWFEAFMRRILEGSPPVMRLLATNPFPDHAPKYVRALLYDYRFASAEDRQRGQWWVRRQEGIYLPQVTLEEVSRRGG